MERNQITLAYSEVNAALAIARHKLQQLTPLALDVQDGAESACVDADAVLQAFVTTSLDVARLERRRAEIEPQFINSSR
jgi:hypothetical protein